MSEAGWGTDKPTVAGWYWIRDPRFVLSGGVKVVYITTKDLMMDWGSTAEFLGPITPDAYAAGRVAMAKECAELVRTAKAKRKQSYARLEDWEYDFRESLAKQIEAQGGEHVLR